MLCGVHAGIRGSGDEEMWRCEDAKMRRYGDAEMQRCGDAEMRRCGDAKFELVPTFLKTCTAGIPRGIPTTVEAAASSVR